VLFRGELFFARDIDLNIEDGPDSLATVVAPAHDRSGGVWYQGLDGVRAIAVTLVFSVHSIGYRTGYVGWTGVPIFFVLSGFLITGILYDNRNEPHRFRNFYVRRTLRIFPLFYFAWLLVLIAGFISRAQWHPIQILWPLYLGNYVRFIAGVESFDRFYTLLPPRIPLEIGHFWSLAVEEQFYLLWPLVVFYTRERQRLIRICIATVLLVPVLRLLLWATASQNLLSLELLYRITPTQCDAFLLGGLMALWMRGKEKDGLLRHANQIFVVSLAALAAAYLANYGFHRHYLSATSFWMSTYGFSLVNMCGAGLILCSLRSRSLVYHITTWWPLRIVGRYSYGIYVFHVLLLPFLEAYVWPANRAWSPRRYLIHGAFAVTAYFLIVIAVSAISYHLLELPFLSLKDRFTTRHQNPTAEASRLSA
jgi:peptidoglycan/LPS O-acetylase OafA/YrhL